MVTGIGVNTAIWVGAPSSGSLGPIAVNSTRVAVAGGDGGRPTR
jgi:hypothetical protein